MLKWERLEEQIHAIGTVYNMLTPRSSESRPCSVLYGSAAYMGADQKALRLFGSTGGADSR